MKTHQNCTWSDYYRPLTILLCVVAKGKVWQDGNMKRKYKKKTQGRKR